MVVRTSKTCEALDWLAQLVTNLPIQQWDSQNGQQCRKLMGHGDWINAVAFSPDSMIIESSSYDKTIKLWKAESMWNK